MKQSNSAREKMAVGCEILVIVLREGVLFCSINAGIIFNKNEGSMA